MENDVLEIVNLIREGKNLNKFDSLKESMSLREDLEFSSFDLAELTVRLEEIYDIDIFEDGLVETVGEVYSKLQK